MRPQRNFDWHKFFTISAIVVGVGFFLTSLILSKIVFNAKDGEIEKEQIQVPSLRSPESLPVVSDTQEKADAPAKPKRRTVSAKTSISFDDSHPIDPHQDKEQSDKGQSKTAEEVLDEKMYLDAEGNITDVEKWSLARMHKQGWFKPEDIPIIYGEPNGQPDGVYIWTKYKPGGPLSLQEPPEHVKARAKELNEALDRATEMEDAREMFRIMRELSELHRPYKGPSGVSTMYRGSIPDVWTPYFRAIFEIEKQGLDQKMQELQRQLSNR